MADLSRLARSQRKQLDKTDQANLEAVASAFVLTYDRLSGDVDALVDAIDRADKPTRAEIQRMPEYRRLMRHAEDELDRFNVYLETAIATAALAALGLGLAHSRALVLEAGAEFTGLESNAMKALLEYLREDGPLYARLKLITDGTIDKVVQAIIDGVGLGFNPQKIAGMIQDAFGGGLTDALRNMRTVQLYSYRDAARANYMASDGIVQGWIWYAELDADTCMSCVAEHGTLHDLDEQLDGHYNCRCAEIPYIPDLTDPVASGKEWFDSLSEEQQAAQMGKEYYSAYKEGLFKIEDMTKPTENEIYGTMNQVTSLWELLGAEPP